MLEVKQTINPLMPTGEHHLLIFPLGIGILHCHYFILLHPEIASGRKFTCSCSQLDGEQESRTGTKRKGKGGNNKQRSWHASLLLIGSKCPRFECLEDSPGPPAVRSSVHIYAALLRNNNTQHELHFSPDSLFLIK